MRNNFYIAVLIPALNEEDTIAKVLTALPDWIDLCIVADNNSTDNTAFIARKHGAIVVTAAQKGYGSACSRALLELEKICKNFDKNRIITVFMDGDFSDDPKQTGELIEPIIQNRAHFVLGSRVTGPSEKGALTTTQILGNRLSCHLLRIFFNANYTDLGPFRAIRHDKLMEMKMDDQGFGWTVQMQARAAAMGLATMEIPANYRNRAGGKSKVSGTVKGIAGAGFTILRVIFAEALKYKKKNI
jgi:glycosyltransferase involved in cell wall biosynthesis